MKHKSYPGSVTSYSNRQVKENGLIGALMAKILKTMM